MHLSQPSQETIVNGMPCYSLDNITLKNSEGIIITMSQIARIFPMEQLKESGYKKDQDFFIIEEFLSIYYAYKKNKVYFSSISFLPSTACNLNCRYCLNFNPFSQEFYIREWDALVRDIDLFFSCVDRIMLFHISGGEPMIYKYTADLVEYIDKNYGSRIDTLRVVTNGTIVPKDDILLKLSQCRIELIVDDYRNAIPQFYTQFNKLVNKLNDYNIKYSINKADSWIDLAPEKTDYTNWSAQQLEKHRESCCQSWQELRNGKLYNCNYAAYATVAGIAGEHDLEETYDLTKFLPSQKKELIEFRLGYSTKGYTNFCMRCRGFIPGNSKTVEPAIQVDESD